MRCEDLQFNLSLYSEGILGAADEKSIEQHLGECPLCRTRQSELVALRNELRNLQPLTVSADFQFAVRSRLAEELRTDYKSRSHFFDDQYKYWLQFKIFPYLTGVLTTFTLAALFMISLTRVPEGLAAAEGAGDRVIASSLADSSLTSSSSQKISFRERQFAALRQPYAVESPSFNPNGTFMALTEKLAKQNLKDDEITFVADVFSNGLAQISEVVNAPKSQKSLDEIQHALQNDPAYAPFVPAILDNRSDVVRVVVKIQSVEVSDTLPRRKK